MEQETHNSISFLDCHITTDPTGYTLNVYRKPTHSNRYLHYTSHHPSSTKKGVVRCLANRSQIICSNNQLANRDKHNMLTTFEKNGYPSQFLHKTLFPPQGPKNILPTPRATVTIPYFRGLSEKISRYLNKFGIRCVTRSTNTLGTKIMRNAPPKSKEERMGVIYKITCNNCQQVYVGETSRHLRHRIKEHKTAVEQSRTDKSAVAGHCLDTGHTISWDTIQVLATEQDYHKRLVAESFFISKNDCFNGTVLSTGITDSWRRLDQFI
jgi:hypothetical protein